MSGKATTTVFLLCIDDYPRGDDDARLPLTNVRLLDRESMREVGASGVGAWGGYAPAINSAVQDAIRHGRL